MKYCTAVSVDDDGTIDDEDHDDEDEHDHKE